MPWCAMTAEVDLLYTGTLQSHETLAGRKQTIQKENTILYYYIYLF